MDSRAEGQWLGHCRRLTDKNDAPAADEAKAGNATVVLRQLHGNEINQFHWQMQMSSG